VLVFAATADFDGVRSARDVKGARCFADDVAVEEDAMVRADACDREIGAGEA
jgi:hypothetical protein